MANESSPIGRDRGQSVTDSILFRGSLAMKKGGRGGGGRGGNRRTSNFEATDFDGFEGSKDEDEDMAAYIDEIDADDTPVGTMSPLTSGEVPTSVKPPPPNSPPPPRPGVMKPKPPPPAGTPKPKPPPPSGPPPRPSAGKPPPPSSPSPQGRTFSKGPSMLPAAPTRAAPVPQPTPQPVASPNTSPQTRPQVSPGRAPTTFMPPPPPTSGKNAPVIPTNRVSSERRESRRPTEEAPVQRLVRSSSSNNSTAFSNPIVRNEADYEVVIHSSMFKRGKMKWNQRYCVLVKPRDAPGGHLFYFKNAKQFMKQASSGGSVSVDVSRLFAAPTPGKEVPKELTLLDCRIEANADGWSTPTNTFGLMIVDDKGTEYPFATDSNQMRNQWVTGLDRVMHSDPTEVSTQNVVPALVSMAKNSSLPMMTDLASPGSGRNLKEDATRRGQQGLFNVSSTGLVIEVGSKKTVSLRIAQKLLSDRKFMASRRSVEAVMRELLTYMGDPALIPQLFNQTIASEGEVLIKSFLSRLIELLSLEPIDSPATSRSVGCTVAILSAWIHGHPVTHRFLTTYPLLGELSYELNALVLKTDHPGLLHQIAILLSGIYAPCMVPVVSDVVVCVDKVIKIADVADLEDLSSLPPIEVTSSDNEYLAFLKRDKSPLWPILFKLISCPSEKPRVIALRLFAELSSFAEVSVAMCSSHEHRPPKDRKSAGVFPGVRHTAISPGGNRRHVGSVEYDAFVEDIDEDEEGDTFSISPALDTIFPPPTSLPDTNNAMARGGRAVASVPRGRNGGGGGIASVPRQPSGQLPRVRSAVSSVPRGGSSGLSRVAPHSASSPSLSLPIQPFAPLPVKRRSPVVAALMNLLSAENGEETRAFALASLRNLLSHSQALHGYESVLRAVCTPDVMSASDLFSSIYAKALRHLSEAITVPKEPEITTRPHSASVFTINPSSSFEFENENLKKPAQKLLSLNESASIAIHQEIADSSAICLWLIGCLLTQHSAMSANGVKPSDSFAAFCEKLQADI